MYVNKEAIKKTAASFKKNWLIVFTGFVYTILNILLFTIIGTLFVGPLYILSGIVMAIVSSAMISNYLYLLFNIINYNKISIQDFKDGFLYYLRKIYGVLFFGYLGSMLLSLVSNMLGSLALPLYLLIYLGVLIILNPLPETIYLKYYDPMESIIRTFEFMKENWLNWIIPNIVFLTFLYIVMEVSVVGLFSTHISFGSLFNVKDLAIYLLSQVVFSIMMIYRGHLYKMLSGSTRRKRMFMNKF